MKKLTLLFCLMVHLGLTAQPAFQPLQPVDGPGGSDYRHLDVRFRDFAASPEGYWLFEPAMPTPDTAPVVVFLHGYGGYNPMIYGKWIRHLVRKGNIVIFPRYQQSLFKPSTKEFAALAAQGIRDALLRLQEEGEIVPVVDQLAIAAHSYGGVIAADLAISFQEKGIPQPKAMLLCSPGASWQKGGILDSYTDMPSDVDLLIVVSEKDHVVGDKFGKRLYREAAQVQRRNLLRQFRDKHGYPKMKADHNQSYCLDRAFDAGIRNYTSRRALRISTLDVVDYFGYWKLFDALLACTRSGEYCEFCFGDTAQQRDLGNWSDGQPVQKLEVTSPIPARQLDGQ